MQALSAIDAGVFKGMVDHALQGIMVHVEHKPLYINHAWAALHGLTVAEVMAKPTLIDLIHDVDCRRLLHYASDRFAGLEPPQRYRYRAVHKDGHIFWLEQFVTVIDWIDGKAIMSTVIDVDDEERRAAELRRQREMMEQQVRQRTEALTRSNEQLHVYQSIIDQVGERISVIGKDYRFRMTNQANAAFRKRSREELIGVHLRETVGDAWFEEAAKRMLDDAFAGQTGLHERKTTSPSGEPLHVEVKSEPFRDPDGTISGAIVSIRDVTVAKMFEEQLRLFASVVEQVSDRISVIDTDYRYRLTNKANLDYHGKPIEAFVDQPVAAIVGEDEFRDSGKRELDRCFAGETVRLRRPGTDGEGRDRVLDILLEPYREPNGRISGAAVTIRDVTESQQLAERLAYQARHDQLTGLVNRSAFEQCLETSLADTSRSCRSSALCFIDLDQFKVVNDTVGHLVGDKLLQDVSKLLVAKVGKGDILARLGGDEFGLLLQGCSLRRAKRAAESLIGALNSFQFLHEGMMFEVGASIGITAINRHAQSVNDVMAQADLACYAAKDKGRNQVQIYQKRDVFIRQRREEMYRTGGIRAALDKGRFVLFSQPIAALGADDDMPRRVEVLLRMLGEHDRLIMPSAFIPAAERYGFMAEVDRWVIRETIEHLGRRVTDAPPTGGQHQSVRRHAERRDVAGVHPQNARLFERAAGADLVRNHRDGGAAQHREDQGFHARAARLGVLVLARRLRQRPVVAQLSETPAGRLRQDRRFLHPRRGQGRWQPRHGRSDPQHGARSRHQDGRRGRRGRAGSENPRRHRDRLRAGLCRRPAFADGSRGIDQQGDVRHPGLIGAEDRAGRSG